MKRFRTKIGFMATLVAGTTLLASTSTALAQAATPKLDSGDTAWMLISTALVLMMTIPGLALFYGGMVRKKNVLSVLMQCFAITCLMSILWMIIGYSLAFDAGNGYVGGFGKMFLRGMTVGALNGTIPDSLFMVFQMTFAIITPALIVGAFADRMKFSALLWFTGLWLLVVYAPITHWVWGGGFLGKAGVLDFAGGTVVHINAGIAGLVAAIMVGKRTGLGSEILAPHNLVLSVMGRLVRLQRGLGARRQWHRRHGHGSHPDRHGRSGTGLDVPRVDAAGQTERAWHHIRRCRRARRHHPSRRLRDAGWRALHRRCIRHRVLLGRHLAQAQARL